MTTPPKATPSAPAVDEFARKSFEALVSSSPFEHSVTRWPDDPAKCAWPGAYRDLAVDLAWHAWQAAADRVKELEVAAGDVLLHREGILPVRGWLRDNDRSRAALARLAAAIDRASGAAT